MPETPNARVARESLGACGGDGAATPRKLTYDRGVRMVGDDDPPGYDDVFDGGDGPAGPAPPSEAFPELTRREVGILDPIARGLSKREIPRRFRPSEKKVRSRASNAFARLHGADRTHAATRAWEARPGRGVS